MRSKRTTAKKPSCILTSDWHIRPDQPFARIDDFWIAQESKIHFIINLAETMDCPILIAGDIGHRAGPRNWPFWLLDWCIKTLSKVQIITIPGQHDLPNHNLDLFNESGMGILDIANGINTIQRPILIKNTFGIFPFPWGKPISDSTIKLTGNPNVAITHQMVIEDKKLWPDLVAPQGHELLKKYPQYDLILSGDNHIPFTIEYEGRRLVNPGSLMRTAANQMDHRPRIYLWWAESNNIEKVYIPIDENVLSRKHIDRQNNREKRFEAFVKQNKKLQEQGEITLSFKDNMTAFFNDGRILSQVKELIIEAMESKTKEK